MALARPPARRGTSTSAAEWLYLRLRHRRGLRLAAAVAAAVFVFVALVSDGNGNQQTADAQPRTAETSLSSRLAPGMRGIPVPAGGAQLQEGDMVDVHEIRTGQAVAHSLKVVAIRDDNVLVETPIEKVDAMVDALTTGGLIVVLAPRSQEPEPTAHGHRTGPPHTATSQASSSTATPTVTR